MTDPYSPRSFEQHFSSNTFRYTPLFIIDIIESRVVHAFIARPVDSLRLFQKVDFGGAIANACRVLARSTNELLDPVDRPVSRNCVCLVVRVCTGYRSIERLGESTAAYWCYSSMALCHATHVLEFPLSVMARLPSLGADPPREVGFRVSPPRLHLLYSNLVMMSANSANAQKDSSK